MQELTEDEKMEGMIKNYLINNLTISHDRSYNDYGDSVNKITLLLDGEYISSVEFAVGNQ